MTPRILKFWGIVLLVISLFWLRIEEFDTLGVSILGFGVTSLSGMSNQSGNTAEFSKKKLINFIGWGITPITIGLMLIKNGIHGHGFPEYSLSQTINVLWRMPFWLMAGYLGIKLLKRLENH